jgi:hypothetical protein
VHEPNGRDNAGASELEDVLISDLADLSTVDLETLRELPRGIRNQRLIDRVSRPRGNAMVAGPNSPGVAE